MLVQLKQRCHISGPLESRGGIPHRTNPILKVCIKLYEWYYWNEISIAFLIFALGRGQNPLDTRYICCWRDETLHHSFCLEIFPPDPVHLDHDSPAQQHVHLERSLMGVSGLIPSDTYRYLVFYQPTAHPTATRHPTGTTHPTRHRPTLHPTPLQHYTLHYTLLQHTLQLKPQHTL